MTTANIFLADIRLAAVIGRGAERVAASSSYRMFPQVVSVEAASRGLHAIWIHECIAGLASGNKTGAKSEWLKRILIVNISRIASVTVIKPNTIIVYTF